MIFLDISSEEEGPLIGLQRKDKRHTYLYWKVDGGKYRLFPLSVDLEKMDDMCGIGPDCLVEWSD